VNRIVGIVGRVVAVLLILTAIVYAGDYALLRYRMANKSGGAFGTVQMEQLYAIPQKSGKIDYEFDARQPEVTTPCVHALFPHAGYSPCWYLRRNSQKPIPM
jgi:hypothetical protein